MISSYALFNTNKPLDIIVLSRRRGSGRNVIDDIDFPMAILAFFFSRRRLASKQRYCHIRQTICSTIFVLWVCLLVVWCKNFQPPLYRPPKFKIFHCKMQFFVKSPICCRSSTTAAHRIEK